MLPIKHRLRKKRDIEIVFHHGRFVSGMYVTAKVWRVEPEKFPKRGYSATDLQIAVVVGKKVSKHAVQRNRVRRRLREVLRLLLQEKRIKEGYMVMIIAKEAARGKMYQELAQDVTSTLARARLMV